MEPEQSITPKGQANKTKDSWANAVRGSPQKLLKTHEKVKYKHKMLGKISISVGRNCDDIIPAIEVSIFREVIIHALKRGKEVDKKFVINTYHADTNLPTIKKVEDVPFGLHAIRAYMPHLQVPPRRIKKGKTPATASECHSQSNPMNLYTTGRCPKELTRKYHI